MITKGGYLGQAPDFSPITKGLVALDWIWAAALPVTSFAVGLFARHFGTRSPEHDGLVNRLHQDNQRLSARNADFERKLQDLTSENLYQRSREQSLNERKDERRLASLLLDSVTHQPESDPYFTDTHLAANDCKLSTASRQLFGLLISARPEILAVMDLQGHVLCCNEALMAFYGYSHQDCSRHDLFVDLLAASDAARAAENLRQVLTPDFDSSARYAMRSRDQSFKKLLISPEVRFELGGSPLALLACVASAQVRSSDFGLDSGRLGFDDIGDLLSRNICCLSNDMQVTFVSPEVSAVFGEKPRQMTGNRFTSYISHRHQSGFGYCLEKCRQGSHHCQVIEMKQHDGQRNFFNLDIFPALGSTGQFLGALLVVNVVTSLKLAEEKLSHRLSLEKMIARISTQFIAIHTDDLDKAILSVLKSVGDFEGAIESHVEIYPSKRIRKGIKYDVINKAGADLLADADPNQTARLLERYKTVAVPIVIGSETLGSFKFCQDNFQSEWLENDLELIRLIGEILINALIRKENEMEIKLNETRLLTTLHSIGDAVIATDTQERIILINKTAENLTGWQLRDALHHPISKVFSLQPMRDRGIESSAEQFFSERFQETDDSQLLISRDGTQHYVSVTQSKIKDASNTEYGRVTVFRDVTRQKIENDEIRYISYHDKLTGLYNRAFFEVEMARLNTQRQYPVTIILGDCNGLKIANDVFGHLEGDKLLQNIAVILRSATRAEDIIARWGGDEFAIILPQTNEETGAAVRERILALCAEADCTPIQPSIALGSATNTEEGLVPDDLQAVLKLAEDRMYRHKLMEGKSARNSILLSIEKMIFEKSCETEEHARRMNEIARQVGQAIGLTDFELEELSLLSVLHDMGKIGIPDNILQKPERLTDDEWSVMQKHTVKGYDLARATPELASIAESILHHHERWDGKGYPAGLSGEEIPRLSRVLSIIDAYDVITHSRPYKQAQDKSEALQEIERCAGSQFDPSIARVFIDIMRGDQKS